MGSAWSWQLLICVAQLALAPAALAVFVAQTIPITLSSGGLSVSVELVPAAFGSMPYGRVIMCVSASEKSLGAAGANVHCLA